MAKVNTGQRATNQLNPYAKLATLTASYKADPVHIVAEITPKIKTKKEDLGSLERDTSPEAAKNLVIQK